MNELSLFSGAGGGLLGAKMLGWRTIGYVENEEYCQKIIIQRIKDGYLDAAPAFGDIRDFIRDGYAASYRGTLTGSAILPIRAKCRELQKGAQTDHSACGLSETARCRNALWSPGCYYAMRRRRNEKR